MLDYYLELIRKLHIRTYAYLGEMRASTNPLAYCEAASYGGHLEAVGQDQADHENRYPRRSVSPRLTSSRRSCTTAKSLAEDGRFALETLQYIKR